MNNHKTSLGRFKPALKSAGCALLILAACWLLSSCQAQVSTAILPAPETWRVQVTPSMRWLGPVFNQCTLQTPYISLLVAELPQPALDPSQVDFAISLEPAQGAGYSAIVGRVGLALVVNASNPISQLHASDIQSIFSGKTLLWDDLPAADCLGCTQPPKGPVQPYIYPNGDDVGKLFSNLFPGLSVKLVDAILAPDPAAIRQAVASDPQGIGYLPAPWIDSSIHSVKISDLAEDKLQYPVVLSASAEPEGVKRSWVLCVQESLNK
jgi:DNA-binding transcriptional LysR family regulator